MEERFNFKIKEVFSTNNINLTDKQIKQFYDYMQLLLEWNEKINLTAITEVDDIILKHFLDSVTINSWISENSKIIDVGTGAGFPGIPIHILYDNIETCLLDSLNKRILFLQDVINKLGLNNIKAIHGRAEEKAQEKSYREKYDIVVSRAVAPLNILSEYCLPFAKKNGKFICMKGPNTEKEIKEAERAINILGGKIEEIKEITIGKDSLKRNIICIKKEKETPKAYPRKAGKPSKEPIL